MHAIPSLSLAFSFCINSLSSFTSFTLRFQKFLALLSINHSPRTNHYLSTIRYLSLQMTLVGYNHKLVILLETVIQRLANFEVKPDRFAVIKVCITWNISDLYA